MPAPSDPSLLSAPTPSEPTPSVPSSLAPSPSAPPSVPNSKFRPLPGDAAWWMFLSAEFVTLCMFFGLFAIMRANNLEEFQVSQAQLSAQPAFINALILITSGYFAARGVLAIQSGRNQACSRWLAAAAILGAVFLGIKTWEYADKLGQGIGLSTSTFFFFYYFLTGFHYLHVWLGTGFLALMSWRTAKRPDRPNQSNVESSAAFWHMLDLVWVILFPLLYLL